ncbi:hypothetical protein [Arsenophonus nasoniae]|uniref:Uncharacterized protein n=1 Tax=Arsenophonus nasoniae TaxID=638 RepID=A0AA95GU88_9GAMM|nr:hypothetical protein [Arsenophonus nasoniae]WGL94237.1 hypothetical protein QE207_10840 [Arsenophonus nasoniae]WGM03030.1 hypothetical protein QE210_08195 [Arsenophonus nasoniae]
MCLAAIRMVGIRRVFMLIPINMLHLLASLVKN